MKKINKLIIPAAGIGSRFLPFTKSVPKEMLPLSNKPAIQYIVQEAIDAEITNISIVLSPEKTVILDYFSCNHHLDQLLEEQGKSKYMDSLNNILKVAQFQYFIQNQPKGLANALLHAQAAIDTNELFAVALPDDIIFGESPEIQHLKAIAERENAIVIAVQEVSKKDISLYGVISIREQISENVYSINSLVEKPSADQAPSNLAIVGRYIFSQKIFKYIQKTPPSLIHGEVLLPETINLMIEQGEKVLAYKIQGIRYDVGTPEGWLKYIIQNQN
jgi:UTP--glucose-1-phosphate uridylyltransferase